MRRERICAGVIAAAVVCLASAQGQPGAPGPVNSHLPPGESQPAPRSTQYEQVQQRLARGWNTWEVHSVATQVLLPEGLAIHVGMKHNSTLTGDAFLANALIGRLDKDAERVTPGPHSWDGSYTDLSLEWKGYKWRVQSAHDGDDLVMLVSPFVSATTKCATSHDCVFGGLSLESSGGCPAQGRSD